MVLALDISSTVIGVAILAKDGKVHEISYIKFKPKTSLFEKLDEFIKFFEKYSAFPFENIVIEEPLKRFAGKFSSADTIQKLTQMNSLISGFLYKKLNIEPVYFNVQQARKLAFPELIIPKTFPNKKYLIWEACLKMFPTINWLYSSKNGKLLDENFDMADAITVGLAFLTDNINKKIREKN
jgi:hypothetical protein